MTFGAVGTDEVGPAIVLRVAEGHAAAALRDARVWPSAFDGDLHPHDVSDGVNAVRVGMPFQLNDDE